MTAVRGTRLCIGTLLLLAAVALLAFSAPAPAEAAKCTKKGTNGDDILKGSKRKKDVLCGKGGNDILLGRGGNDQLLGGDGDDVLDGGTGKDKLKGQEGADAATYAESTASVVVNLGNGSAGDDTLSEVENVTGSPLADTLIGSDAANIISGGEGNDSLAGGLGNDTLSGDGGTDTANYFGSATGIVADLADGTATGEGNDSLPGVENVTGSPHNDSLAGNSGPNTLHGGAGTDTVSFDASAAAVTVDLGADTATGEGTDSIPAIENVVGSDHDDSFTGDTGANSIAGGDGSDTVSYAGGSAGVTVDLLGGTATGAGNDALADVENVVGTDENDALAGNEADNTLTGGDGNDLITSGSGSDTLAGDDGADELRGEDDDDVITGGAGDDVLDGGTGSDECDGGSGVNQLLGGCDVEAPQLGDFSLSPGSIDTSDGPEQVSFGLQLSDAVTGVDAAASSISIYAPGGALRDTVPLTLQGGDENNGTFVADVTLPRFAAEGVWTVSLELVDVAGNSRTLTSQELIGLTFPGTFEQTGDGDALAPTLADFVIDPLQIDTSASAQTVDFTIQGNDNLAGIDAQRSRVTVFTPGGAERGSTPLELASGDPTGGSFTGSVTIPRLAPQGNWTVSLRLVDFAGNDHVFTSSDLIAAEFPGGFEQTAPGDDAAPDLTAFTFTPTQVDTSLAAASMTFDLQVTDDQSGIAVAGSDVTVRAPDGQELAADPLQLISGSPTDGNYRTTITIPSGSIPGTWTVSVTLVDQAGNFSEWASADLVEDGFPGAFTNIGPDPT